jgi:transcriptional regulator with XRE-family HTH domain
MSTDFAVFIRNAARKAGYDIDSPRGGGKTALAQDTGMSLSSVSRMLSGQSTPDASYFEKLAKALNVSAFVLLEKTMILTPDSYDRPPDPPPRQKVTVDEAAADLGITEPVAVEAFRAMVAALRTPRP